MFESAELGHRLSKEDYAAIEPTLRTELLEAQFDLLENKDFSVVILINGIDGAGRGETVNLLNEWMDPRHIETWAFDTPTAEESDRPFMWRFWRALPPRGRIGVMFNNWYTQPIRALCALAPERYEYDLLADIPTGSEEGVEVTFAQWRGFIAPGGIDDAAKEYWIAKAKEYEQSDAYKEFIESNMLQPVTAYGDDFVEYLHQYAADVESVLGN